MFLKRQTRRKNAKAHVYWELVESYRTPRGSRHRRVAYLGELSASERTGWGRLARLLDGKAARSARQLSLFENDSDDGEPVPDEVVIDLRRLRVENARGFGDVYLAILLWKALELDSLFDAKLPGGREDVRWGLMACMISASRFVEPSSEVHISDEWYGRTALPEMLGVPVDRAEEHRLYRTLDRILPLKRDIETHLKERIGELFNPDHAMWKTLETWMERAGLGRGARTVIRELAHIRAVDVVLRTSRGRHVRVACVTRPTHAQQILLDRLGIELPERLGRPRWIPAPADLDTECSLDFEAKTPQIAKQRPSSP